MLLGRLYGDTRQTLFLICSSSHQDRYGVAIDVVKMRALKGEKFPARADGAVLIDRLNWV